MTWFFGEYLLRHMEEKQWSQIRLAEEAGISPSYISVIVNGLDKKTGKAPDLSVTYLIKLADALELSVFDVFLAYTGTDPESKEKPADLKTAITKLFSVTGELEQQQETLQKLAAKLKVAELRFEKLSIAFSRHLKETYPDEDARSRKLMEFWLDSNDLEA
jgi:transcriptional regulator with XRE-family HTH domain